MAGDINVYPTAANSGTEWDDLASGYAAASAGDVIEISGSWSANDTGGTITIDKAITIRAVGSAKFTPTSTTHYVRENNSSGHVFEITAGASDTVTVEGFEAYLNNATSSAEGFRLNFNGTFEHIGMRTWSARSAADQDGIYAYHTYTPDVLVRRSYVHDWRRCGLHRQHYSITTVSGTLNWDIESSLFYNCGDTSEEQSACAAYNQSSGTAVNQSFYMNAVNSVFHGGWGFDYGGRGLDGTNLTDYSIGLANSSVNESAVDNEVTTSGTVLTGKAVSDATTVSAVIVVENDTPPYDFRLVDHANNAAQDVHSTATILGITIGTEDIYGTSRPQNSNYDLGPYEIPVTATSVSANDASHAHTADNVTLSQVHTLAIADASHAHSTEVATLSQIHNLIVAAAIHDHTVDIALLSPDISVDDATHIHITEGVTLNQIHALAIADAAHAHAADIVTLAEAGCPVAVLSDFTSEWESDVEAYLSLTVTVD